MSKVVKLDCGMANDLLPLYVDDVLSENSKQAVSAHIADCKKCQQIVKDMNMELSDFQDKDIALFKRVQKKFKKMYVLKAFLVILILTVIYIGANIYVIEHFAPIWPKADSDYIKECLEVVELDGKLYLHEKDLFAGGEIVFNEDDPDSVVSFYLGKHGINNLGLGEQFDTNEKYVDLKWVNVKNGVVTFDDEGNMVNPEVSQTGVKQEGISEAALGNKKVKKIVYRQPNGAQETVLWEAK